MDKPGYMNVVLNFHRGDQASARLLLELLIAVDEGIDCTYYLQYGDDPATLHISETVLRFMGKRHACFSSDLPDIKLPHSMIYEDPNLVKYGPNNWCLPRSRKFKVFAWNLCVFKYIYKLDSFLMIEPDSVVLKKGWLKDIYEGWNGYDGPILGHLKKGKIRGELIATHWAGSSVYDCTQLRDLPLDKYFYERYPNPWWLFMNERDTTPENNCFWGPMFSGYDVSYDYFLFGLYWREKTGSNNPYEWPLSDLVSREDLIFCDWSSKMKPNEIMDRFSGRLSLFHGVKDDEIREVMLKFILSGEMPSKKNKTVGGPKDSSLNKSFQSISNLKNRFINERCFIIGNGPSLNRTDLTLLKNEYTIGANRIYLNYEKMGFEPMFYCSVNPNVIEQFGVEIDGLNSIKFLRADSREHIKNRWNVFFMKSLDTIGLDFNKDLETFAWYEGGTVTYCAMQIAFYLGFKTVILLGVDHFFKESGEANKLVTAEAPDSNHFHPDYFGKGVKWQYPDLERSEKSYKIARKTYEENGRQILDATVGGRLEVFPKIDYMSLFSNKQITRTEDSELVRTDGFVKIKSYLTNFIKRK